MFDSATGRLWVVCRGCEKWNLVPFDSRLETIDVCEGLFRDAKLKFSTDNIGIARLPEGLELVRIGPAERHEFAAWRYGDQFGRRRRNDWIAAGALSVALIGGIASQHAWPVAGLVAQQISVNGPNLYRFRRARGRIGGAGGGVLTQHQVFKASFSFDEMDRLAIHVSVFERAMAGFASGLATRRIKIRGDDVLPALGLMLPHLNRSTTQQQVRDSVNLLGGTPSPESLAIHSGGKSGWGLNEKGALTSAPVQSRTWARRWFPELFTRQAEQEYGPQLSNEDSHRIRKIPYAARLALEMLAHETTERAALAGELKLLERQWKEADSVAKIADELVLGEQ